MGGSRGGELVAQASPVVAIGAVTRTGSVALIALAGTAVRPSFAGRWEASLTPADMPSQPYHAAADLAIEAAESVVGRGEGAAEQAALAALRSAAADLGVSGPAASDRSVAGIAGVAVVVKAVSVPGSVAAVLRSHTWMHAAEGVLYREAVLAAARAGGWPAHAVDVTALPSAEEILVRLGAAAGRPWRRQEKDAARAALTLLPGG